MKNSQTLLKKHLFRKIKLEKTSDLMVIREKHHKSFKPIKVRNMLELIKWGYRTLSMICIKMNRIGSWLVGKIKWILLKLRIPRLPQAKPPVNHIRWYSQNKTSMLRLWIVVQKYSSELRPAGTIIRGCPALINTKLVLIVIKNPPALVGKFYFISSALHLVKLSGS